MVSDLPTSHASKKTNQLSRFSSTTSCAVGMGTIALSALLLFVHPISNNLIISNVYAQLGGTNGATPASSSIMADPPIHNANSNTVDSNNNNTNTLFDLGTATAKVKPDKVTLILGVETTNKTAKAALSTNSATMNKVINVLLATGVKQNETSTSAFSISPNYNYSQGRNIITGFSVTNSIQIESSNINNTAKWIDTAVSSGGATTVNSVDFTLSDKKLEEIKNGLIKQAINNARSKAEIAVSALGVNILGVKSVSVNEVEQLLPQPFLQRGPLATAAATPAANPTPIISGQQEVSVSVSLGWLIG
jgi:uncharacterized protein YggE